MVFSNKGNLTSSHVYYELFVINFIIWAYINRLKDGFQVEFPDYWLNFDNPWELPRLDVVIDIHFGGNITKYTDEQGRVRHVWEGGETIQAVAYDVPIPGEY